MPDPIHWLYTYRPDEPLRAPVLLWPADLAELGDDQDLSDRFGVAIDLGGPRTVIAASLDRLERWFIDGLTRLQAARAPDQLGGALGNWVLSHPAVQLLDRDEPGLLWARTTVGEVPASETAVCWQHVPDAPRLSDYGDLPEPAPLEDCTCHEALSCVCCGRNVAELVEALQHDESPSDIARAIMAVAEALRGPAPTA